MDNLRRDGECYGSDDYICNGVTLNMVSSTDNKALTDIKKMK